MTNLETLTPVSDQLSELANQTEDLLIDDVEAGKVNQSDANQAIAQCSLLRQLANRLLSLEVLRTIETLEVDLQDIAALVSRANEQIAEVNEFRTNLAIVAASITLITHLSAGDIKNTASSVEVLRELLG
jgi:hypothetical protein